jgi:hypothetical protein
MTDPSFRIIASASKSLPPKDWLFDEHTNMFFAVPSQPMDAAEEAAILLETGAPQPTVDTLLLFADKYRRNMSSDTAQKSRKLGTRSLVRIATRFARFPSDLDLHTVISRSLLAEFLPASEQMSLNSLLDESGIRKVVALVILHFAMAFWIEIELKNNAVLSTFIRQESRSRLPCGHQYRTSYRVDSDTALRPQQRPYGNTSCPSHGRILRQQSPNWLDA